MNERRCRIYISAGKFDGSLADFLETKANEPAPLLAWAEPDLTKVVLDNDTGRRDDFQPLVRGAPHWPADLPLVEAGLFWQKAALHVVAEDQGCGWVRVDEGSGTGEGVEVAREQFDIHTLRDWQRFGFGAASHAIEKLSAVQYRRDGRLIAWRLLEGR